MGFETHSTHNIISRVILGYVKGWNSNFPGSSGRHVY